MMDVSSILIIGCFVYDPHCRLLMVKSRYQYELGADDGESRPSLCVEDTGEPGNTLSMMLGELDARPKAISFCIVPLVFAQALQCPF